MNRIRAIDLFCGAGGSSWGAQSAGVEIIAAFDKWDTAGLVYQDNFPKAKFYSADLSDMKPRRLKKQLGKIDLLLASPECTNHSPAKGAAPRCEKSRETAFHVIRFAREFKPRWIVVENVISMRKWRRYRDFLDELENLGYNLKVQVLNAADFGVPQARLRLFVICDREDYPPEIIPPETLPREARLIISQNGDYKFSPLRTKKRASATLKRAKRAIEVLGKDQPFLIVYYGSDHAGGWQSIDRPLRTITTLDRFAYVKPENGGYVMRMLQPEELKIAMGWPKYYRINHGTRRNKIKMIGNAVCPKVMKAIIKQLASQ
jgi:DNA (cytosine-5)-methyltransferase 1